MERGHAASVAEMLAYAMAKIIPSKEQFTAIDIGCGNGWVVRKVSSDKKCINAIGVDGSIHMIEKAKMLDDKNEYFCSDLLRWIPKEKVDIVHSTSAFLLL